MAKARVTEVIEVSLKKPTKKVAPKTKKLLKPTKKVATEVIDVLLKKPTKKVAQRIASTEVAEVQEPKKELRQYIHFSRIYAIDSKEDTKGLKKGKNLVRIGIAKVAENFEIAFQFVSEKKVLTEGVPDVYLHQKMAWNSFQKKENIFKYYRKATDDEVNEFMFCISKV